MSDNGKTLQTTETLIHNISLNNVNMRTVINICVYFFILNTLLPFIMVSNMRECVNDPNYSCYICGKLNTQDMR